MIDEKTLFSALQGELNARVTARTTVNTTHMQTIALFASASMFAMFSRDVGGTEAQKWGPPVYYFLLAFMPIISFYFLTLYAQHDRQIGLLNRHLRLIEERSHIPEELRFFTRRAATGRSSYRGRFLAHCVVTLFGCTSFLIFVLGGRDFTLAAAPEWHRYAVDACIGVTALNVIMMIRLELFRRSLIRPDEPPCVEDETEAA